ncbi:hypothetical protein DL89DRAFT_82560 [Linderina pennispora]|uniref:Uncharacterized protein n=1 Tax=Linderina pennispora TaxID=61395 RepID=A0A1Y1WH96_9FUNG|nr:uncharacterized protein DL89DRAFT_82560 [Linderina pennispora]ORX72755.1 hypothetical protein DL89DRAFT_82560 [Linderina pennispora]
MKRTATNGSQEKPSAKPAVNEKDALPVNTAEKMQRIMRKAQVMDDMNTVRFLHLLYTLRVEQEPTREDVHHQRAAERRGKGQIFVQPVGSAAQGDRPPVVVCQEDPVVLNVRVLQWAPPPAAVGWLHEYTFLLSPQRQSPDWANRRPCVAQTPEFLQPPCYPQGILATVIAHFWPTRAPFSPAALLQSRTDG